MNSKFDLKAKRLLKARDPPLVTIELSFSRTGSHGKYDDIIAKSEDVLSQQPDGTRRFVIYGLWRTD